MKILLYTEGIEQIGKSGLGKAIKHQMKALKYAGVEYTLDPDDDYDIVHINTYGPKSYALAKACKKNGKKIVYHAHSTEEDFKDGFIHICHYNSYTRKNKIKTNFFATFFFKLCHT